MIVRRAIPSPIVATVKPVVAWVTRRTTARAKIIQLMINPFLSVMADFGVGKLEVSMLRPADLYSFLQRI